VKKVLIISYHFPPRQTVGSQRPFRLAKYFSQFGWEPIILTAKLPGRPPDGIRVIETDYKDIAGKIKSKIGFETEKGLHDQLKINIPKKFTYHSWKSKSIKLIKDIINFPDEQKGWHKYASKTASEFLFKEKIDAIISTAPPHIAHIIARKLKIKNRIPWIVDLRDLWTQHQFYNKFHLIYYFEKKLELKILSDADVLVTVTQSFKDKLKILHRGKKIYCIQNSYDTDEFSKIQVGLSSKFTITYSGLLYNGKRDPSLLFHVISQLIRENKINKELLEIRFYVPKEDWLIEDIKKYDLEKVFSYNGFIPREKVIEKQKESQLLLLLLDSDGREEGVYPAKIFEYFGAKRPIIAYGGRNAIINDLLEETKSGKFAANSEMLKSYIKEFYDEFIKYGEVKCYSNKNIQNYTSHSMAEKYCEILDNLV
jgi:glycosyltransferase involved in cell wall biosynthesis